MADMLLAQSVIDILIIAVSMTILNLASDLTISNAVKVSRISRLGKTAVGFSILAFSTSLPELTVALVAAFSGGVSISVGNVFGSNIVNISLISGLAAILLHFVRTRKFDGSETLSWRKRSVNIIPSFARSELSSIYFGLFISSVIPLILIYVSEATWVVGLILISIFFVYMYQLSKIRIPTENGEVSIEEKSKLKRYVSLTLLGAVGISVSAYFLVESAVSIAHSIGVPQAVIGATIIALGTSLPELSLDLRSFIKGQSALAFGDIIGSSFVNITLILGITLFLPALVGRAVALNLSVYRNLVIFSIITNLFFWYFLSQGKISWKEGALFLFIYVLFLITILGTM